MGSTRKRAQSKARHEYSPMPVCVCASNASRSHAPICAAREYACTCASLCKCQHMQERLRMCVRVLERIGGRGQEAWKEGEYARRVAVAELQRQDAK
eukprot:4064802-Pleurochrysis_carterae.AAC.1